MIPEEAWRVYATLRSDRRIAYFAEPPELRELWSPFTQSRLTSPNLWTDAYLCAFTHAAQLTLVTFDTKIPSWKDVSCIVLGA
jgi:hypothetical protein